MKKILCVGYRDWALNIYNKISQDYNNGSVVIISNYDEYSDEFTFTLSRECSGITEAGFQHSGKFSIIDKMLLTAIYL